MPKSAPATKSHSADLPPVKAFWQIYVPLSLPGLTRQIYLVRRRDESLSVAAQALYALVMAQRP